MRREKFFIYWLIFLFPLCLLANWEEDEEDEFLSMEETVEEPATKSLLPSYAQLRYRLQNAVWLQRLKNYPLAKSRHNVDFGLHLKKENHLLHLDLHSEFDTIYLHHKDRFFNSTIDTYQTDYHLREAYITSSWQKLDLTIGRQVLSTGAMNMSGLLDLTNPLDLRIPADTEISDLKMGILASRLSIFINSFTFDLITIHERGHHLTPAPRGEFGYWRNEIESNPQLQQILKDSDIKIEHLPDDNSWWHGFMAKLMMNSSPFDLGVYLGRLRDYQGVNQPFLSMDLMKAGDITFPIEHPFYNFAGLSLQTTQGKFLLLGELIYMQDFPVLTPPKRNRYLFDNDKDHFVKVLLALDILAPTIESFL